MSQPLLPPATPWPPQPGQVYNVSAETLLRALPSGSVNCIVTSPPYFGLRDYGMPNQIGLERTPAEYVARLVALFHEARRVLRDDGTFWLNLGDSYNSAPAGKNPGGFQGAAMKRHVEYDAAQPRKDKRDTWDGLPEKSLLGIPWRVAFGLQDDGWILRSDIIWAKTAPMPESVMDRPTKSHEYIFLFAKSQRYFYDAAAIAEPAIDWGTRDRTNGKYHNEGTGLRPHTGLQGKPKMGGGGFSRQYANAQPNHGGESERRAYETRNKRSVWTVGPEPFHGVHFATFPTKLIEPCILAGCPVGGVVYDPFMGSGTTALVARAHGRNYIGSEINPEYVAIARDRLRLPFEPRHIQKDTPIDDLPMFAALTA